MHNFIFSIDTIYVFDLIIMLIDPIVEIALVSISTTMQEVKTCIVVIHSIKNPTN
jgi:hypothetical protein